MIEIISVRFKSGGKEYYFNPNGVRFQEYKDESDLKSRLSFLQMALSGIADGNAFAGIVGGLTGGHEGGGPSGDGASQGE